MKTKRPNATTMRQRQQKKIGGPRGTSEKPPCGSTATCQEPLESDQKNAFPFPQSVTTSQLADLLGVSTRRVGQLTEAGVLNRNGRGTYPAEAITAFCEYQRHNTGDDSERRFREARAKLTETRQRKAQLELDLLEGKSLRTDIAKELFTGFVLAARSRLLALPTRCAPQVCDLSTPGECHKILNDAVYEALTELAGASDETARAAIERHRAELNVDPLPGQQRPQDLDL